ncbi:HAMP domain-containing protein [Cohnella sp. CFH 77786]|uniref:cache domain-containing sensor histidine kinase n=1 Tax=Cohnella sp. CFH 77786 TaxID=2662265 RepID=UPI001C60D514|nr:sensor histidine kinase [Cohnella sp. CFH 77786]MBW5448897.1 HAMP domain-containing protein [Cohnella sp. CFH 77786]
MKLRNKMVLANFLFFILPFMIIGFFVVDQYRQSALDKATEQTKGTIERVKTRAEEMLDVVIAASSRLMLDSDLETIVTTRYQNTFDVVDAYREYEKFRSYYTDFNPEISRIKLYVDNPTLLNNWEFLPIDEETKKSFWFEKAQEQSGLIGWYYFQDVTRNRNSMLSLVRGVYFPSTKTFGVQVMDVNTNLLDSMLRQENTETLLADANGVIVASNRASLIGRKIEVTHLGPKAASLTPGTYDMTVDGHKSKVLVDEFMPDKSFTGLRIMTVSPIESIVREANHISRTGLQIISVAAVLALILIYLICTMLTKRLLNFSRQISRVSMGNFNVALEVDGNDEIGQITRQFNQMVANIRELMEEVKRSHEQTNELERKQSEIRLKMLASQINPHFLYNALESIRMKAHLKGEKEISQAVKMLGKLMRKNLEIKGQEISLKDEIEIVRCYLEIQKFRHDSRLEYDIEIEPGAERVLLLPLLIQPLVENSVIHGLERHFGGGKVAVRAHLEDGGLTVTVEDNGIGFSPEKLEAVRQSLAEQEAERIGLNNIQQRLRLTYGSRSELRIESNMQGTNVSFWIPLKEGIAHVQSADRR